MSKTLQFPLRLNPRGGAAQEERNINTLIELGLLPTGANTAWDVRDNLVVPSYVWESDGPALNASVRERVTAEFARLEEEGRARLLSVTRAADDGSGEARFVVDWVDLETGTADSVVLPSSTGSI
jgi:hypothetical protein